MPKSAPCTVRLEPVTAARIWALNHQMGEHKKNRSIATLVDSILELVADDLPAELPTLTPEQAGEFLNRMFGRSLFKVPVGSAERTPESIFPTHLIFPSNQNPSPSHTTPNECELPLPETDIDVLSPQELRDLMPLRWRTFIDSGTPMTHEQQVQYVRDMTPLVMDHLQRQKEQAEDQPTDTDRTPEQIARDEEIEAQRIEAERNRPCPYTGEYSEVLSATELFQFTSRSKVALDALHAEDHLALYACAVVAPSLPTTIVGKPKGEEVILEVLNSWREWIVNSDDPPPAPQILNFKTEE